ncbi:glutamate synthase subunit beta [Candidatus Azobacteroides pseudotrichonymphae]|uniref:Glutamate synthase small subunit n=1 Tax=Azobacteroides pseudotrichonymphae genomovar. CFP2 TaxID=511995 RepID=B6YQV4_AZOPC|nr:glutamate synthase subunit beta [Candidatus Azobacteroides pseudotrichonymphae]BAG83576.1 glutamate synthase small subunit [Candidatus Azobacteroides pseudotrichonymphae genomovar. CFP2]
MGNSRAFLTINRKEAGYRPILERINDFGEVEQTLNSEDRVLQASRCMECGVPFCHWACPIGNSVPEWQDLLYKGRWQEAYNVLISTDSFPEFTGRICPALCEKSCVLNLENQPLTIRENEVAIVEYAFSEGYVVPRVPLYRSGKRVAIIGSGPAGLAVADMLNQKGHMVVVYEKDEYVGGLLRLGIPDFKLNKEIVERRLNILKMEGIEFKTRVEVGKDILVNKLLSEYDAICLAVGSGVPRDLPIKGRNLKGIHFALDFLKQQNRVVSGQIISSAEHISAKGKNVLVIGGGDTGSDCVGTSVRQKAAKVTQIEILPMPPEGVNAETPWPTYPNILKISSSHEEGCERRWSLVSKQFLGEEDKVTGVKVVEVEWIKNSKGCLTMKETGKVEIISAELVLLSMGFTQPVHEGLLDDLGVRYDIKGNVEAIKPSESSVRKVFVAGDVTSGASLVVRAIDSGRKAAEAINIFLR